MNKLKNGDDIISDIIFFRTFRKDYTGDRPYSASYLVYGILFWIFLFSQIIYPFLQCIIQGKY